MSSQPKLSLNYIINKNKIDYTRTFCLTRTTRGTCCSRILHGLSIIFCGHLFAYITLLAFTHNVTVYSTVKPTRGVRSERGGFRDGRGRGKKESRQKGRCMMCTHLCSYTYQSWFRILRICHILGLSVISHYGLFHLNTFYPRIMHLDNIFNKCIKN